jgi:hypothetical protein
MKLHEAKKFADKLKKVQNENVPASLRTSFLPVGSLRNTTPPIVTSLVAFVVLVVVVVVVEVVAVALLEVDGVAF